MCEFIINTYVFEYINKYFNLKNSFIFSTLMYESGGLIYHATKIITNSRKNYSNHSINWKFLARGDIILSVQSLRVRLMVGHIPLEDGIGVRVPDPQQLLTKRTLNLKTRWFAQPAPPLAGLGLWCRVQAAKRAFWC